MVVRRQLALQLQDINRRNTEIEPARGIRIMEILCVQLVPLVGRSRYPIAFGPGIDVFLYIPGVGSGFLRGKFSYNLIAIGKQFLFGRSLI